MTTEEKQSHITMWDAGMGCDLCGQDSWWFGTMEQVDDFHADDCPLKGDRDAHRHLLNYEYIDGDEYKEYLRKRKASANA